MKVVGWMACTLLALIALTSASMFGAMMHENAVGNDDELRASFVVAFVAVGGALWLAHWLGRGWESA